MFELKKEEYEAEIWDWENEYMEDAIWYKILLDWKVILEDGKPEVLLEELIEYINKEKPPL